MGRRKPPSEVYRQWESIAFPDGEWQRDQDADAWRRLYLCCFSDGRWHVDVDDATLVATLGLTICLGNKTYSDALEAGRNLIAHPNWASKSELQRYDALVWLGAVELTAGDMEAGNITLRTILSYQGRWKGVCRNNVARALGIYCEAAEPGPVPPIVRALARDLLFEWPGKRQLSSQMVTLKSLGDLDLLINGR